MITVNNFTKHDKGISACSVRHDRSFNMKSLYGPRLDRFLVIPAALQKVLRGRGDALKLELGPNSFHPSRHVCQCRGARRVRAEIIPVEPVWVMPAEGADELVSAKSTTAVFCDHLRLRRDARGFYPLIFSRLEYPLQASRRRNAVGLVCRPPRLLLASNL